MAVRDFSPASSGADSPPYVVRTIRKVRRLPLPGEVLVGVGAQVEPDTVVARISLRPGIPWVVPASRLLGIEPQDLPAAMLRRVGDRVKTKEVIARAQSGLYGRKELESPTDGIIEEISDKSGRVVIREEFGKEEPPISVDVALEIGVRPRDLPRHMLVKVGQEVKKGQIIAKKGEAAAFFTKVCTAPISGVVSEINERTGHVVIARPFKEVTVTAYIQGRVVEVIPQRGVVVETVGVRLTGAFGVGRERHGPLAVAVERHDQPLTADRIGLEHAGKIVVGGSYVTNDALKKALELGVRGIVTATASYLDLVRSLGVRLGVGITGQEDVEMTVILMEGFGDLEMRPEVFRALQALEGRPCSINGATQIRAGAIRPEIIVPLEDWSGPLGEEAVVDEDLSVGQRVRVITAPYFGAKGAVRALPREEAVIETEARVPVCEVELDDGRVVVVPRKNVEPL